MTNLTLNLIVIIYSSYSPIIESSHFTCLIYFMYDVLGKKHNFKPHNYI